MGIVFPLAEIVIMSLEDIIGKHVYPSIPEIKKSKLLPIYSHPFFKTLVSWNSGV